MRRQDDAVVTVFNTYSMSNIAQYLIPTKAQIHPNGHVRSTSWPITSTNFTKTLSYLIQIYVYIMRRQEDAVVTVFNTYSMSNSPISDPD